MFRVWPLALVGLTSSFLLAGCVPRAAAKIGQPVTVTVQAPPSPPTPQELEKPPNIILEKPERDPFAALGGEGESTPSGGGGGEKSAGGGNFIVSGIMRGGPRSSAIVESGTMSYIVHPGDRIGDYRVTSITARSVVLVRGKEKLVLSLLQ